MKIRKIISIALTVSLLIGIFSIIPVQAGGFCLYPSLMTLTGAQSADISTNNTGATFTQAYYSHLFWLYADYDAGFFDTSSESLTVEFAVEITAIGGGTSDTVGIITWTNQVTTDFYGMVYYPRKEMMGVELQKTATGFRLGVWEVEQDGGTNHGSSWVNLTDYVTYYCRYIFDDEYGTYGIHKLYVYSDADRSNQIGYTARELYKHHSFQYYELLVGYGDTGNGWMSGIIDNICLSDYLPPEATTYNATGLYYNPYTGYSEITLNGHVESDGGDDACTCSFYYKKQADSEWSWANAVGTYEEGENFTTALPFLEPDEDYEYYARVTNESGYDNGETVEFNTDREAGTPEVDTLAYPINIDSDTTIYGYVLNDGGENCTGWMEWSLTGTGNWTATANTTDLVDFDYFNGTVENVTEDTTYYYRAALMNGEGTGYGGTTTFIWYNSYEPTFDTLPASNVQPTSATISTNITDDGGAPCLVHMRYRKLGVSNWNETYSVSGEIGDILNWNISGLASATTYQAQALGWNEACYDAESGIIDWQYGDTVQFTTGAYTGVPVMRTDEVGYLTDWSLYAIGSVLEDNGECANVWFEYREIGTSAWISNAYDSGTGEGVTSSDVCEGYEVTHYIGDLEYGGSYEVRVVGQNIYGTGYGQVVSYLHATEEDIESGNVTPQPDWVHWVELEILHPFGLNNTSGKLFFTIFFAVVVFLIVASFTFKAPEELKKLVLLVAIVLACLSVVLGMIIGFVPTVLTVGVLIAAAGTLAVLGVKIFRGGHNT